PSLAGPPHQCTCLNRTSRSCLEGGANLLGHPRKVSRFSTGCSEKHIFHLLPANKCVLPPASLGAVFGMTTCVSAEVRDAPDDPLNFFIGGCTSGVLLGAKTHSAMTGTSACLGLGTLAFFIKVGKMEGWKLSGPPKL
uniref:NADH dehydrogenase [ubiquinone] 1 alpha subcomplex subunit 11 n=1 Tax=Kryptolebias marmoratus TaxID=37003 RepID=A0A3Q3AE28_KRYMA